MEAMVSNKQLEANRKNALNSTGPKTVEGKLVSSRNSIKHGLLARDAVIKNEDEEMFNDFRDCMMEDLAPSGPLETSLAERIVIGFWKLRRVTWLEKEYYNFAIDFGVEGVTGLVGRMYENAEEIRRSGGIKGCMGLPPGAIKAPGDLAYSLFSSYYVLGNFRRYESEIDRSLYRAIAELDRRKEAARKKEEIMAAKLRDILN